MRLASGDRELQTGNRAGRCSEGVERQKMKKWKRSCIELTDYAKKNLITKATQTVREETEDGEAKRIINELEGAMDGGAGEGEEGKSNLLSSRAFFYISRRPRSAWVSSSLINHSRLSNREKRNIRNAQPVLMLLNAFENSSRLGQFLYRHLSLLLRAFDI